MTKDERKATIYNNYRLREEWLYTGSKHYTLVKGKNDQYGIPETGHILPNENDAWWKKMLEVKKPTLKPTTKPSIATMGYVPYKHDEL